MFIPKIIQNTNNNYLNNQKSLNVYSLPNTTAFSGVSIKSESKFLEPIKKIFKPFIKAYDGGTDLLAKGLGKIFNTESAIWIFDKTKRSKLLMNHLMTFGSTILSGFYVIRTLGNKDLDEKKKKTLAINQTAVFGVSTVLCYTLDGLLNKSLARFTNRYEVANYFKLERKVLEKCVKGMPAAKSVGVFDIIYRLIAPVMITPIANHLGNKLNEKNKPD